MTTIAFKDGVLAADRLICEGNERYGHLTKIGAAKDADGRQVLFAACASSALGARFCAWAKDGLARNDPPPSMQEGETSGFGLLFYEDGQLLSFDPGQPPFWSELLKVGIYALGAYGSGACYAIGAMTMAATAPEAILVAARYDTKTGGGVDVVSFRDPTVRRATLLTPI